MGIRENASSSSSPGALRGSTRMPPGMGGGNLPAARELFPKLGARVAKKQHWTETKDAAISPPTTMPREPQHFLQGDGHGRTSVHSSAPFAVHEHQIPFWIRPTFTQNRPQLITNRRILIQRSMLPGIPELYSNSCKCMQIRARARAGILIQKYRVGHESVHETCTRQGTGGATALVQERGAA